jgi:ribosomal protein S18 acetylase RimI-like enzyme
MVVIREARSEDVQAVLPLLEQLRKVTALHDPVESRLLEKTLEDMLRRPDTYRNYLAVEDGRIVGLITLVLYKTLLHPGGTGLVNELVVAEDARGRGIGRSLLDAAISAAREQGMDEVEVGTEIDNLGARDFYRRLGFDQEYVLLGREL